MTTEFVFYIFLIFIVNMFLNYQKGIGINNAYEKAFNES